MIQEIEFEGSMLVVDTEAEIQPGDIYIAQRNTGRKLLTCKRVDKIYGLIVPVGSAYCFTVSECKKVLEIK